MLEGTVLGPKVPLESCEMIGWTLRYFGLLVEVQVDDPNVIVVLVLFD